MPPEALERASLRAYLEARRREIEAQLFLLVKKHGVQTVQEFDAAVRASPQSLVAIREKAMALLHQKRAKDAIQFVGFIPEGELRAAYIHADVTCFPSRYGFGLSTLESV
jgi:glycosyltransferase involved in cell wall biosynthesis